MNLSFVVEGKAEGKDRPRFANGHVFTTEKTREFEAKVRRAAAEAMKWHDLEPATEPVTVTIICHYLPPKSATKKFLNEIDQGFVMHDKKPDADNIIKAVCDAMNGVVFDDDKRVASVHCTKWYSTDRDCFFVRVHTMR